MRTPEVLRKLQGDGSEPAERATPAALKAQFARDYAEVEKQMKQLKLQIF